MRRVIAATLVTMIGTALVSTAARAPDVQAPAGDAPQMPVLKSLGPAKVITEADCTTAKVGDSISPASIGEPVAKGVLMAPRWTPPSGNVPGYCGVDGVMSAIDTSGTAPSINIRVLLPAAWSYRAVQIGGGGMNGSVPNLMAGIAIGGQPAIARGFATYGSDSGHQGGGGRGGTGGAASAAQWALSDEAIRNLGYMQMKKAHDAAMVVIDRMYGERPRYNYYAGTSQGGREALTVAQRYPADYDGVVANVPVVNFSSLMLAPGLIRIQERPLATWVTRAKVNAIRGEFMRQCDGLDGLVDGVINSYMACRATFDVSQGTPNRHPWAARRCPGNIDPDPADTSANACLTDGQISTLEFVYRRYRFSTPLANGVSSFGMWLPNTDPAGSGLIADVRFRGQEGASAEGPMHGHLGILGVTGFLMRNLSANPLDYTEGGPLNQRRVELSAWLDSTDPDLAPFATRGGKMIVTVGTNDTLASPGAQLDYFQSVIDKMTQSAVDTFARFFVIPQASHGLTGTSDTTDGAGKTIPSLPIPNTYDRLGLLIAWVEEGRAPGKTLTVSAGERSLPLCSYPTYPRYVSGPTAADTSYTCARP